MVEKSKFYLGTSPDTVRCHWWKPTHVTFNAISHHFRIYLECKKTGGELQENGIVSTFYILDQTRTAKCDSSPIDIWGGGVSYMGI